MAISVSKWVTCPPVTVISFEYGAIPTKEIVKRVCSRRYIGEAELARVVGHGLFCPLGCSSTLAPCRIACAESVTNPVTIPLWSCAAAGVSHIAHAAKIIPIPHSSLSCFILPVAFRFALQFCSTLILAAAEKSALIKQSAKTQKNPVQ